MIIMHIIMDDDDEDNDEDYYMEYDHMNKDDWEDDNESEGNDDTIIKQVLIRISIK